MLAAAEEGKLARWTGLEPATPGVTGRYSNQLSYHRANRGGLIKNPLAAVNGAERENLPHVSGVWVVYG